MGTPTMVVNINSGCCNENAMERRAKKQIEMVERSRGRQGVRCWVAWRDEQVIDQLSERGTRQTEQGATPPSAR